MDWERRKETKISILGLVWAAVPHCDFLLMRVITPRSDRARYEPGRAREDGVRDILLGRTNWHQQGPSHESPTYVSKEGTKVEIL